MTNTIKLDFDVDSTGKMVAMQFLASYEICREVGRHTRDRRVRQQAAYLMASAAQYCPLLSPENSNTATTEQFVQWLTQAATRLDKMFLACRVEDGEKEVSQEDMPDALYCIRLYDIIAEIGSFAIPALREEKHMVRKLAKTALHAIAEMIAIAELQELGQLDVTVEPYEDIRRKIAEHQLSSVSMFRKEFAEVPPANDLPA